MGDGTVMTLRDLPEPGRLFGPPNELGTLWFEEIRRRSDTPSIAWSDATRISKTFLDHLGARLQGTSLDEDLHHDLLRTTVAPEIEDVVALRSVFRKRALARLPPERAVDVVEIVDEMVDELVGRIVKAKLAVLESAAFVDPLTGVGNRRALERDLARELARAFRHGRPVAVAAIDLDGLKGINDQQGHAAGDETLRRLATTLMAALRVGDVLYRVGGDEFVVVLPETSARDVEPLFARAAAAAPAFSYGVAEAPTDATTAEAVLALADDHLLQRRRDRRQGHPRPASAETEPAAAPPPTTRQPSPVARPEAAASVEAPWPEPEAPRSTPSPDRASGTRVVIAEIVGASTDRQFSCEVSLRHGEQILEGRAAGPMAAASMHRVVAAATLDAVSSLAPGLDGAYVDGVSFVQVGDDEIAVVNVVVASTNLEETCAGAAHVRQRGRTDAVARAALSAVNRRVWSRSPLPDASAGSPP